MTKTPVIFATFARPEYARQAFNHIKRAKPEKFYFYSNKARSNNPQEIENNNQVRALVKEIDWDCEIKTFFREEYVDLYTSLWGAYDWVFENEDCAIILEEDCVASLAFFDYCDQLVSKFENDKRIWLISGNNFFENYNPNNYDYIFTRYAYQWGWATWRDRWQKVKRTNIPWEEMKKYDLIRQLYPTKKQADYHIKYEDKFYKSLSERPAWDLTMGFTEKSEGSFGIIPVKNLVMNIGCLGTHHEGMNSLIHNRSIATDSNYKIEKHPPFIIPDYKFDQHFFKHFYYNRQLLHNRILRRIKVLINRVFH